MGGVLMLTVVTAEAKRAAPELAEPVRYGPYEFRASGDPASMGTVQIWDRKKGREIGEIKVYRVFIRSWMEADVQWVFIRSMSLDWPVLTLVNERGKIYRVRVDRYISRFTRGDHGAKSR